MTVFRIISIIISVAFIVLAFLNFSGVLNETLQGFMTLVGVITAVFNVLSVVMWWITDKEIKESKKISWQLSWYDRLSR